MSDTSDDRLSAHQKAEVASRYSKLNQLLNEKRYIDKEINDLNDQIAALRRRAQEVDHQFNKLVVEVEPTVVGKPAGAKKTKKTETSTAEKIAKKLKDQPELLENEELQKLLAGLS